MSNIEVTRTQLLLGDRSAGGRSAGGSPELLMSEVSVDARAATRLKHARRAHQPHAARALARDRMLCPPARVVLVLPRALSVASWSAAHSRAPPRPRTQTVAPAADTRRSGTQRAVRRCEPRRRGRGGGERSGSCGRRVRVSCVRTESGVRSCFGRAPAGRRSSARRATARAARRCWRRVRGLAGASVRPRPSAPSRALFVASAGRGRQPTATGHRLK